MDDKDQHGWNIWVLSNTRLPFAELLLSRFDRDHKCDGMSWPDTLCRLELDWKGNVLATMACECDDEEDGVLLVAVPKDDGRVVAAAAAPPYE